MSQEIVGPLTVTSPLGVQGGSLELGATLGALPETPYVDFHFGTGAAQDFNVRLINPANNHLDVVTEAGGPVLSVHADKVGIGTTSPAAKLVVHEPAGGAEVRVDGNGGLIGLSLGADAAQPWVGTRTNHALRLLTNNTEQVRVQANGHVGIGTPAPDTRLNVNSGAPTVRRCWLSPTATQILGSPSGAASMLVRTHRRFCTRMTSGLAPLRPQTLRLGQAFLRRCASRAAATSASGPRVRRLGLRWWETGQGKKEPFDSQVISRP